MKKENQNYNYERLLTISLFAGLIGLAAAITLSQMTNDELNNVTDNLSSKLSDNIRFDKMSLEELEKEKEKFVALEDFNSAGKVKKLIDYKKNQQK